jgi:predicted nicotinamide N-methyase
MPLPAIELPVIPGGWGSELFEAVGKQFDLWLPQKPDAFLDDPGVIEANRRDDYMPYWATLWPGAKIMARLIDRAPWPRGSELLELGAGVGLVGLAALALGSRVVFSDYDPVAVEVCRYNAVRNGLPDPEALVLDWRNPPQRQFSAIVGCEVTYDHKLHAALLGTLEVMLARDGVCWLGDPGRFWSTHFFKAASEKFHVRVFDQELRESSFPSATTFQVFELRWKDRA